MNRQIKRMTIVSRCNIIVISKLSLATLWRQTRKPRHTWKRSRKLIVFFYKIKVDLLNQPWPLTRGKLINFLMFACATLIQTIRSIQQTTHSHNKTALTERAIEAGALPTCTDTGQRPCDLWRQTAGSQLINVTLQPSVWRCFGVWTSYGWLQNSQSSH